MSKQSSITLQEFVSKWRRSELTERAGSHEHFIDLCHMLGHPTPAKADPEGATFTFEKGVDKRTGGQGWADKTIPEHSLPLTSDVPAEWVALGLPARPEVGMWLDAGR